MKINNKISYRNLIILIIAIIILLVIGIAITMARYRSEGTTSIDAEVAFFALEEGHEEGHIMLSGLYPREDTFEYDFTIANTDGTIIAETSLEYTIELKMTTNLPLDIEIYKNDVKMEDADEITNEIVLDESGQNYIRKINIKNGSFTYFQSKTDKYTLSAKFPTTYKATEEYQNMIDHVSIVVDVKQKID